MTASHNSLTGDAIDASPAGPGLGQAINYVLILFLVTLIGGGLLHLIGPDAAGFLSSDECWDIG